MTLARIEHQIVATAIDRRTAVQVERKGRSLRNKYPLLICSEQIISVHYVK